MFGSLKVAVGETRFVAQGSLARIDTRQADPCGAPFAQVGSDVLAGGRERTQAALGRPCGDTQAGRGGKTARIWWRARSGVTPALSRRESTIKQYLYQYAFDRHGVQAVTIVAECNADVPYTFRPNRARFHRACEKDRVASPSAPGQWHDGISAWRCCSRLPDQVTPCVQERGGGDIASSAADSGSLDIRRPYSDIRPVPCAPWRWQARHGVPVAHVTTFDEPAEGLRGLGLFSAWSLLRRPAAVARGSTGIIRALREQDSSSAYGLGARRRHDPEGSRPISRPRAQVGKSPCANITLNWIGRAYARPNRNHIIGFAWVTCAAIPVLPLSNARWDSTK